MNLRSVIFTATIAGAVVAVGCSSGALHDTTPFSGSAARPAARHAVRTHLVLRIPHERRGLHAHYVSPGTKSFVVAVQPVASTSPWPSPLPLQILNVAAPYCSTTGGSTSGETICSFTIDVIPGLNKFSFVAYSGTGGAGKVLSAYQSASAIPVSPSGSLRFSLDPNVASVIMFVDGVQNAPIPIGAPASLLMDVLPLDAAGYLILTVRQTNGPRVLQAPTPVSFLKPFSIAVSPAGKGVKLSNDLGSGSSVTIGDSKDLAVTVVYDGSVSFKGTAITNTSFTFAPSFANGSPAHARLKPHESIPQNVAFANLASNAVAYTVATTPPTGGPNYPEGITYSAVKNATFYSVSAPQNMQIGSFALAGSTFTNSAVAVTSGYPGYPFADKFGDAWYTDQAAIDCYKQFTSSSPDASLSVIPLGTKGNAQGITQDVAGDLWATSANSAGSFILGGFADIPETSACNPGSAHISTYGYSGYSLPYLYAIGPQSTGGGIWTGDSNDNYFFRVDPGVPSSPSPAVHEIGRFVQDFLGFSRASNGTVYAFGYGSGYGNDITALQTVSQAGVLTSVGTPPYGYGNPPIFAMAATGKRIAYGYDDSAILLLYDQPSNEGFTLPMPGASSVSGSENYGECNGATFDGTNTPWALCTRSDGSVGAYRVLLTPTWSVFPSRTINADLSSECYDYEYDLGIGEAFPLDSSPFDVAISQGQQIATYLGTGSNQSHVLRFELDPYPGTAIITITDKNGRAVNVTLNMASDSYGAYCGGIRRSTAKHSRIRPPGSVRTP